MMALRIAVVVFVAAFLLNACVTVHPQTTISRGPGWYTVKKTDTLYSIAWRYGLDYNEIANWNNIKVTDPIYPGQRLRLIKPQYRTLAESKPRLQPSSKSKTATETAPETETSRPEKSVSAADQLTRKDPNQWRWPTEGKLLSTFDARQLDRRGIDIAGNEGQPVYAVADGKVVYSGNGLAGYGNLIIIKHSDTFLSAYAYCQERLVQEGMAVESGKVVAKMGLKDSTAKLYFEIRRNGKPVDPMKYLPKR